MSEPGSVHDLVEQLAEEFLQRYRRGEKPTLSEYAAAHPELADEIRDVFPAILLAERMGQELGQGVPFHGHTMPERLGPYRILREIGRGGMAIVYEAIQEPLNRRVALKILPAAVLNHPTYRERFQREARAAGRLQHPGIVPIFEVGEHAGVPFYAMQFIAGRGLDKVLRDVQSRRRQAQTAVVTDPTPREDRSFPPDSQASPSSAVAGPRCKSQDSQTKTPTCLSDSRVEDFRDVARIGLQVAEALAYAHQQGVIHRDIKPSNIILADRPPSAADSASPHHDLRSVTVYITDFGLAKADDDAEGLTRTGDVVGTLRYMAPERFRGISDPRSDVYGLGATLFEIATGRPAFFETDRPRLIEQVLHEEPPPPRKIDRRIPRDLETIIRKAMAKELSGRYASAEHMAEDLRLFLADRPIQARPVSWQERTRRWCRRNPKLAAMAGFVVMLLLVIVIGSPILIAKLWQERQLAREQLWSAHLARAEAQRMTQQAGRRFQSLQALDAAVQLLPTLKPDPKRVLALRNRFIASLSLADLGPTKQWPGFPSGSTGVCFNADLKRYVRSDSEGNLSVRSVETDRELIYLPGSGHSATTVKFSPDGRWLAAGYQRHANEDPLLFRLWNCDSGVELFQAATTAGCGEADFSPDNRRMAFSQGVGKISLRTLPPEPGKDTPQETTWPIEGLAKHLLFHPDSQKLAFTLDRTVEVRDINTWELLDSWTHPFEAQALAWTADGSLLAVAAGSLICLWNPGTKAEVGRLVGHDNLVTEIAFNHAGNLLASKAHDGTVRLWDVPRRRVLVQAPSVFTGCAQMRFSPDDRYLAFTSDGSNLTLWAVAPGSECQTWEGRSNEWRTVEHGNFSPDGRWLAVGGSTGVRIWNTSRMSESIVLPARNCFAPWFLPDGSAIIAATAKGLIRWSIESSSNPDPQFPSLGAEETIGPASPLLHSSLSANGRWFVARGSEPVAELFDLQLGTLAGTIHDHDYLRFAAVSPDGSLIATGSWYGRNGVKIWKTSPCELLTILPSGASSTVAFRVDGKQLAVGTEAEYQLWDVESWKLQHTIPKHPETTPGRMSYAGNTLALRHAPSVIHLIDSRSATLLAEIQAPDQRSLVWHVLSPQGDRLAACSSGGRIHVWDLRRIRQHLADRGLDWNE